MLEEIIAVARGEAPADLLLRNAQLVNVCSGEIHPADVAIYDGKIAGFGEYEARETLNLKGRYLCPGFIDGHVHLESSMVAPPQFARAVVPRGTTAVVSDPHEIANVLGVEGIRYMLDASQGIPLDVYVMLPSCVPATHMGTSGATLPAEDLAPLWDHPRVIGLAEMMNAPGVLFRDPGVLAKLRSAGERPIDGHAPSLSGKDLAAYISANVRSDHECTTLEEAWEKLRLGMHIFIREGTTARNLRDLLPLVTYQNAHMCHFCTDDRHPADLLDEGHIDDLVRTAIGEGLDPILAIQMATFHTARYFGLTNVGAVAPGYGADLVVFDNPQDLTILQVFKEGQLVAEGGEYCGPDLGVPQPPVGAMNVALEGLDLADFGELSRAVPAEGERIKVIEVVPGQIVTRKRVERATVKERQVVADPERDLLKMAVVERHHASGNVGLGFVRGFGLKRGAIASSVAHDAHNIVVIGTQDGDMLAAVDEVVRMRGGQVVVAGGEVLASVPLPVAGLMSNQPLEEVRDQVEALTQAAHSLGCVLPDPLMTMSFLALEVIPELKLTDQGLVDVTKFDFVPLFGEE